MATVPMVEHETLANEHVAEELKRPDTRSPLRTMPTRQSLSKPVRTRSSFFTDIDMPGSMDGLKVAAA